MLLGTTKPNKILAAHLNPDNTTELEKQVKARFSDVVDCFKSSPWYLEIVPKGVNKGTAIQALCRHYGIGKDNVMAEQLQSRSLCGPQLPPLWKAHSESLNYSTIRRTVHAQSLSRVPLFETL